MANGNGDKSTALMTVRSAANLPAEQWSDARIEAITKMVAPKANLPQLAMFLGTAARYDLDPLLREVWLGELNGKPTVITGRDGYIKVAQRDPGYRGFDSGVVRANDSFRVERRGAEIEVIHNINGFDRGPIVGSYCVAFHATRRPVLILRGWNDYRHLHDRNTWKQNPEDMIETRAIVAALKRQFNISGIYTAADGGTTPDEAFERDEQATSRRVADQTRNRMDALRERLGAQPAGRDVGNGEEIQDAEFEVVRTEPEPPAPTPEPVSEPEKSKRAAKARAKSEPAAERPADPEREKLNARYFALASEVFLGSDFDRKAWQERVIGKASCRDWTIDDYRTAIAALERGEWTEPPERAAVQSEQAGPGLFTDDRDPDELPF